MTIVMTTVGGSMVPQRISKSKLKARMLEIFRDLQENGGEIIVTERDKPVLRIIPYREKRTVEELFGEYRGTFVFTEDPDTPTTDEWSDLS
jgi:antitoxin (DNA-binding transcriptional repressor) of toxin-antitoxin stability system